MATPSNPLRFRIDNVRLAFPVLFKGEQFNGEGKFRCGAQLLLAPDHPQFKQVEAAIEEAAKAKWKDKAAANLKAARAKDKVCLRDGDLKPKYDGFPGNWALSANCAGGDTEPECGKPTVLDASRAKITDPAKSPLYGGCYVNAMVEFYADDRFGSAVNCTLAGIQFRRDGDAFGSAKATADDFEDVAEGASAEDFA
jgi:hypothetical protein